MRLKSNLKVPITIEQARFILGEKSTFMSDQQVEDLLSLLRMLCDNSITTAIEKNCSVNDY
jgi:hypothetical protein